MVVLGKRALKKAEKRKKRLQRKKKSQNRKEKLATNLLEINDSLNFVYKPYNEGSVSKDFVIEVTRILKGFRLSDRSVFTEAQAHFFQSVKERGIDFAINDAVIADHKNLTSKLSGTDHREFSNKIQFKNVKDPVTKHNFKILFTFLLADIVLAELKKQHLLEKYVPFNVAYIIPIGKSFRVFFNGMLTKKMDNAPPIYYSKHKPTIEINGEKLLIGFSRHAIHRICERCVGDWGTNGGATDAFAFFNSCIYFELYEDDTRRENQYYFTFYQTCADGFFSGMYPRMILDNFDPTKTYYYRIGYCPIVVNGNFACGKTMLPPGMRGTPEDKLLRKSNLSREEKHKIYKSAENAFSFSGLAKSQDFTGLKWFHDNGVPQIVELPENPYIDKF